MDKKAEDYRNELLKSLPSLTAIAFGSTLAALAGGVAILGQGLEFLRKINKEWYEEYVSEVDVMFMIDDAQKSAENLQFMKEVIQKVAFETREEKRKRLLDIAINYHKRGGTFDKKLLFLNILDSMSEDELTYFMKVYEPDGHSSLNNQTMNNLLVGRGLIEIDEHKIQKSFEKVSADINNIREFIDKSTATYQHSSPKLSSFPAYNHSFDEPKLEYNYTQLGLEFYDFLQRDDNKRRKPIVVSSLTDFL